MERDRDQKPAGRDDLIEERLVDDQQEGRQNVVDAAADAFAADQESPDSPTRRKRELSEERGVEDPSHSRGSGRQGPGERDAGNV